MEKIPTQRNAPRDNILKRGSYESPIGNFETLDLRQIKSADVELDDRAFIYTESGNRYLLRRSKSREGKLVFYNEREGGFNPETGHPFLVKTEVIAEIGKPFEYFSIIDEEANTGLAGNSSNVTRIELRKDVDAAAENALANRGGMIGMGEITEALKDAAGGKARPAQRNPGDNPFKRS